MSTGLRRLDQIGQALKGSSTVINGTTAFELYDTYGFPLDLTMLVAKERGLTIDEIGFSRALQAQRQRSKRATAAEQSDWVQVVEDITPTFLGYDQLEVTTRVVKYRTVKIHGKQLYQIVLEQTPFYPEGGGQVGDTGLLLAAGEKVVVQDTKRENDLIIHYVDHLPAMITTPLQAVVDQKRRLLITNNHTATHLLHAALKHILGYHVEQRGS